MSRISFTLRPMPPFSLRFTVWALRRRQNNIIDRWDGENYQRIFVVGGQPVKVSISQKGAAGRPLLNVLGEGVNASRTEKLRRAITSSIEKMLGARKDLKDFYRLAESNKELKYLATEFAGLKPPRFPDVFEALVNAFACQQVSLDLGILLLNRLSEAYGRAFEDNGIVFHAFPAPEDLAALLPEDFRNLGFSRQKGRAIIELSGALVKNELDLAGLEDMSDEDASSSLYRIRGVGRWSAQYVLLRGLGRINTIPGDDVGAQRNIQSLFRLKERPDYEKIMRLTSRWKPYAGFVYFHFLLNRLEEKGSLS